MTFFLQQLISFGALSIGIVSLIACQHSTVPSDAVAVITTTDTIVPSTFSTTPSIQTIEEMPTTVTVPPTPRPTVAQNTNPPLFPWLTSYQPTTSILQQVSTPDGYQRLELAQHSFGYWLRQLPLHPKGTAVYLYNGVKKTYQAGANRVINIDIGQRDLQQCADAVMRLRAEYFYHQKTYESIHFNYTSGHTIRFSDWSKGKRPKVSGSKVYFSSPKGQQDVSYQQLKRYLNNVYSYAGTASLSKELTQKSLSTIQPGDVFIQGGFPGHAILVMDVALHPTTGERLFLLAQSYMPAQSIHLLNNPSRPDLSPWYSNNFSGLLETPEWNFEQTDLCQFEE